MYKYELQNEIRIYTLCVLFFIWIMFMKYGFIKRKYTRKTLQQKKESKQMLINIEQIKKIYNLFCRNKWECVLAFIHVILKQCCTNVNINWTSVRNSKLNENKIFKLLTAVSLVLTKTREICFQITLTKWIIVYGCLQLFT